MEMRERALGLLGCICRGRADDTRSWRRICIALKNSGVSFGDFERWSLTERYRDVEQIRRAWKNLRGNYGMGTLCYYAKLDSGDLPDDLRVSGGDIILAPRELAEPEEKRETFDGEKAFACLTAAYGSYSELELENGLFERSPFRLTWEPGRKDMRAVLKTLYRPEDKLFIGHPLAGRREQRGCIKTVKEHLSSGLEYAAYFRPNPLTGEGIRRDNGQLSFVSDDCVMRFPYAVLEFDGRSLRDQYAFFHVLLDKGFPVAALTYSGKKSIHCLLGVNCADRAEWTEKVEKQLFRNYLEILGCDGACKNESRCSRTPGSLRDNGIRQKLLYLNPG